MPIRAELRSLYGREWLTVIRPRVLERAHHQCELPEGGAKHIQPKTSVKARTTSNQALRQGRLALQIP